jgi:hypothetical protein
MRKRRVPVCLFVRTFLACGIVSAIINRSSPKAAQWLSTMKTGTLMTPVNSSEQLPVRRACAVFHNGKANTSSHNDASADFHLLFFQFWYFLP